MKSQKFALLALAVLVVAFIIGTGTPLLRDSEDRDRELTEEEAMTEADALADSWVSSLEDFLDFLSPGLNSSRLKPASSCRFGEKTFRLIDSGPCLIQISKKAGGAWDWRDFEKAVLKPENANVKLKVCYCEKEGGSSRRGMGRGSTVKKTLKVSDRIRIPHNIGIGVVVQQRAELRVSYFPNGETVSASCDKCEDVEEVSLVVLDDGGTIRLACEGCSSEKPGIVMLK